MASLTGSIAHVALCLPANVRLLLRIHTGPETQGTTLTLTLTRQVPYYPIHKVLL